MYMGMGSGMLLYTWIRVHLFSIMEPLTNRHLFTRIILPKLVIYVAYIALLLGTHFWFNCVWAYLPFTSLICFLTNNRVTVDMPTTLTVTAFLLTGFELLMIGGIVAEVIKTTRVLRALNYLEHRSRIVGFRYGFIIFLHFLVPILTALLLTRFFLFHSFVYIVGSTIFENILALAAPPGSRVEMMFSKDPPVYMFMVRFHCDLLLVH